MRRGASATSRRRSISPAELLIRLPSLLPPSASKWPPASAPRQASAAITLYNNIALRGVRRGAAIGATDALDGADRAPCEARAIPPSRRPADCGDIFLVSALTDCQ